MHRACSIRFVSPLLLVALLVCGMAHAGDRGPVVPKGKGEQCVAETDFMRRNHMDLIIHQRDETVIKGIRDEPFSLVECVDCHVQRDANNKAIRIDAEGQFCSSCHEFVAAKIDCFSCHAAIPDADREDSANATPWEPDKRMLAMFLEHAKTANAAAGEDNDVIVDSKSR